MKISGLCILVYYVYYSVFYFAYTFYIYEWGRVKQH